MTTEVVEREPVCPRGCVTTGLSHPYDPSMGNWPDNGEEMILGISIPDVEGIAYYECGRCGERFNRFPYGHPIQVKAENYWDVADGEIDESEAYWENEHADYVMDGSEE